MAVEGTRKSFPYGTARIDCAEVPLVLIVDLRNYFEGLLTRRSEGVGKLRRGVLRTCMRGCQRTRRVCAGCGLQRRPEYGRPGYECTSLAVIRVITPGLSQVAHCVLVGDIFVVQVQSCFLDGIPVVAAHRLAVAVKVFLSPRITKVASRDRPTRPIRCRHCLRVGGKPIFIP